MRRAYKPNKPELQFLKGNEENQAKTGELLHRDLIGPITPAGKNRVLKVLKSWSLGDRIPKGRRPSFGRGSPKRIGSISSKVGDHLSSEKYRQGFLLVGNKAIRQYNVAIE